MVRLCGVVSALLGLDRGLARRALRPTTDLAAEPRHRVVVGVDHPLLERDDGVVGDLDVLWADLSAALGDVALAETHLLLDELTTVVGGASPVVSMLKVVDDGIRSEGQRPARVAAVFLGGRTESSAHEMASRLGKVVVAKRLDRVVHALQVLEPELRSLASVVEGDKTVVYADIGRDELVPLWLLGGGINHLAHIVLAILEEDGRVVLIDEIENGVHHSALPNVWRVIDRAAVAAGAQVFATTHSRECVAAAHQVFSETLDYGLSVRRLEPHNGRIDAVAYDRESLEASLDAGFEVR